MAYNRAYKEAQIQYAAAEAERKLYDECMALGASEKVLTCFKDKTKPGRETQRAEEDLQAQKDMADWAWGMLVVSAVIGFSSIGVAIWVGLYVRGTLVATQEAVRQTGEGTKAAQAAVNITREMGQAQVRAYVSWDHALVAEGRDSNDRMASIGIIPHIKNSGQSPARLNYLYTYLHLLKSEEKPVVEFDLSVCACSNELGASGIFEMAEQWLSVQKAQAIYYKKTKAYLLGWGSYRTVFGRDCDPDEIFTYCFEISFRAPPNVLKGQAVKDNTRLTFHANYHIAPAETGSGDNA